MKKQESDFLRELESKAIEQRKLVGTEILPNWAVGIGEWLVINPWRVIIPLAGLLYISLRLIWGEPIREAVLAIFGGFRL